MTQDTATPAVAADIRPPGGRRELREGFRLGDDFAHLTSATIMMVDDEPLTMEVVKVFLEDAGYRRFVLVEDSREAMARLEECPPDVLLLDVIMPEVSGFDILRALRARDELAHLPVIILTSSSDAETKLQALDLGATDFLSKPVDPSELALRVRNMLAVKAYQDQLTYYDNVTGLPNRKLFIDQLYWALQRARRENTTLALLHIGLDHFDRVVDTFGPRTGDSVIAQVAERLRRSIRGSDVVSRDAADPESSESVFRLGTEDFLLLCASVHHVASAATIATRVLEAMRAPFDADGTDVFLPSSIGIAGYPDDGDDSSELIKRAVGAASHARNKGGDRFEYYSAELNARSLKRLQLEAELRRAIQDGMLHLHYQPKVCVGSGRVEGVEALLRWERDDGSLVSPAEFIPLAEDTGLIAPMGAWVLLEACRQLARWQTSLMEGIGVAVNVSAKQFFRTDLSSLVRDVLRQTKVNPGRLTLEVTESMLLENAELAIHTLNELRQLGVKVAIDDFGTGYSSLSYLKRLPVDELKIDQTFIKDVMGSYRDRALVKATVVLAHDLGLEVVAEGVEDRDQLDFLTSIGCDTYQGYLFARPMPAKDLAWLLTTKLAAAV